MDGVAGAAKAGGPSARLATQASNCSAGERLGVPSSGSPDGAVYSLISQPPSHRGFGVAGPSGALVVSNDPEAVSEMGVAWGEASG